MIGSLEKVGNTPGVALDAPREDDKKPVIVISPATEGTFTWLSSRGDDLSPTPPASGRGDGPQLFLTWDGSPGEEQTKEVEIQFCEPVELHDGHVSWSVGDWSFEDSWSMSVRMPATVATPNGGGEGNCNLVEVVPSSGLYVAIPANGDGTHDVNLEQAVPIPDGYNPKTGSGEGYWSVDRYWSGAVSAATESGEGEFNLYTFAVEMHFCKNMDCGNPLGVWDLDAYKAEWISQRWKLVFSATRAIEETSGKIGGYLMIFRPGAT